MNLIASAFGQDKGKGIRFILSPETNKQKKDKMFEKPGPEPGHRNMKDYYP